MNPNTYNVIWAQLWDVIEKTGVNLNSLLSLFHKFISGQRNISRG